MVRTIKVALKSSLNHFNSTDSTQCREFEQNLEKLVHTASYCAVNGSRLVNAVVLHPGFSSDEIHNQTSIQRLSMQCFKKFLSYSGAVQKPCSSLEAIWTNRITRGVFADTIDTKPYGWKYVIDEAARNFAKVWSTKLVFTYESSLRQMLRTYGLSKRQVNRAIWMTTLVGYNPMPRNPERPEEWMLSDDILDLCERERQRFGLEGDAKLTEQVLKSHLQQCFDASKEFLSVCEQHNERMVSDGTQDQKVRIWSMAPLCQTKRHFAHIGGQAMHEILLKIGFLHQDVSYQNFQEFQDEYFEAIVSSKRPDKWCGQSKQFKQHGYISTDGVSVCIQYMPINQKKQHGGVMRARKDAKRKRDEPSGEEKPKPNNKKERAKAHRDSLVHKGSFHKDSIVVGIDPGRCALAYGYRQDGRSFKLSRGQFYADSGITARKKKQSKLEESMKPFLTTLSAASLKTARFEKMTDNLAVWKELSLLDWEVHFCKQRARLGFDVHCRRQQCLSKFFSSFAHGLSKEDKKRVIVGYGQAKFAATARNELATPTTEVFRVCSKTWPTKLIDEYRTTIHCHDCEERLRKVHHDNGSQNRGLLHCKNACRSIPLKNRDLNAAKNISLVTQRVHCHQRERPAFLSRV